MPARSLALQFALIRRHNRRVLRFKIVLGDRASIEEIQSYSGVRGARGLLLSRADLVLLIEGSKLPLKVVFILGASNGMSTR